MDDKNIKLLGKILTIIFIIIFLIIILYLVNCIFSFNKYKYDIPFENTTTKYDYMYQEFSDEQKQEYNNKFNNDNFIIPLLNGIKDSMNYRESNLLNLEINKFRYLFSLKYLETNLLEFSFEDINELSLEVFRISLYKENAIEYLSGDNYKYNVDINLHDFCIKTKKALKQGNSINILVDLIERNEQNCLSETLNYDTSITKYEMKITYELSEDKEYLTSVVIIK